MKPSHTTPTKDATSSDIAAELPCHQADILRRQIATVESKTGVAVLLRYASIADILILAVSTICAVGSGASLPIMTVVFGDLQHTFQIYFHGTGEMTYEMYMDQLAKYVLYLVYIAVAGFVAVYVSTVGFIYTGEHISAKIREHYLQSCLRQNIAFFDKVGVGEITTRITADTNLIQDGISEKISLFLAAFSTFLTAFIIGFVKYWKFTLIMSSAAFALIVNITAGSHYMTKNTQYSLQCYAEGGNLASEAISTVRSIVAFGAQDRMAVQYDKHLAKAQVYGIRVKRASAVKVGCMSLIISLCYALAFWQGGGYIVNGIVPLSTVVTITMAIMMGTFQLGNMAPNIQAFTTALAAARKIFNTIDRVSPLDSSSEEGQKLEKVQGHIRLQDIVHIYPSRPQVTVMRNMTLDIPPGKTTALVGESGSGKSTIIGLIERFYDPVEGGIFLDGHNVNTLNLRWLRQQMALVSQEPTLFAATIYENICYGLVGDRLENESEERKHILVLKAAKIAHAHAFISNLPDGYETYVGDRGILLSGGQKQRIAIARAIVSDPKILLLDEATSALDTKSEGVVQAALDNATQGRTTIIIAHRLASVRNAHNIVVMSKGQIAEQGTHNELLEKGGIYHDLVAAQTIYKADNVTSTEEDVIKEKDEIVFQRGTGKANQQVVTKQESAVAVQDVPATADITEQPDRPSKPKQATFWSLIKMTAKFNKPETKTMLFGLGVSIVYAGCNPFSLLCFAKEMVILSQTITQSTRDRIKKDSDFWASMYVLLAFLQTILCSAQGIAFAKCSEMLIRRVRYQSFKAILHQDVSFFDYKNHSEGALTSFLATEPTHLAGLSGVTLGTILTLVATLITGMAVSLAIGWKLALVCISVIPLLLGFGFCRFWILTHFHRRSKAAYQESAAYAAEAISAIRTVAPLTREDAVLKTYRDSLAKQQRLSLISVLKSSALFAASQSLYFACLALGFWFGGSLIGRFEYDIFDFYLVFMTIIIGVQSAGTAFAFAPDMGKADQAAREIKALFDRKPGINSVSEEGEQVKTMEGSVEFRDVFFRYPTRPEQPVLRGLNLTILPGQYVALVGASGCGKSTVISLLERFYDPLSGEVIVDGKDIKSFNVSSYRSFISLVSQEPTLYQGTIKENILLGALKDEVSVNAIEAACRAANIYDFIISLPNGFDTMVGNRGSLLSGGQKQRIAIARALIRDPKILLLDEATSALDSESEHVVQAALDIAAEGRTTIAVAHRLSTIQRADMIFVFDHGCIVESGTHSELLNNKGRYAELVNQQSLEKHS